MTGELHYLSSNHKSGFTIQPNIFFHEFFFSTKNKNHNYVCISLRNELKPSQSTVPLINHFRQITPKLTVCQMFFTVKEKNKV